MPRTARLGTPNSRPGNIRLAMNDNPTTVRGVADAMPSFLDAITQVSIYYVGVFRKTSIATFRAVSRAFSDVTQPIPVFRAVSRAFSAITLRRGN